MSEIVNKLVVNFIWNGKKPKIKRDTLIGPKDKGGLELPDYEIVTKSLRCAWVKRMKEGIRKHWMEIPSFYLENVGGPLFLTVIMIYAFLILAICLLSILIFSKRGLKFRGYARLISTKIILEVVSCGITKILL